MHIFVFYIVNTVAYMLRGDVHRCVRALSNVASASHSLLLSPCVRQPLNLAELLGGAKDKGGVGEEDHGPLWCLPSRVFLLPLSSSTPSHYPLALTQRRPSYLGRIISAFARLLPPTRSVVLKKISKRHRRFI